MSVTSSMSTPSTTNHSSSPFSSGRPLPYSAYSVMGHRKYMEDEYFVSEGGNFAAVFDGHGGAAVSRYLRQNLYANVQAALPTAKTPKSGDDEVEGNNAGASDKGDDTSVVPTTVMNNDFGGDDLVASALRSAFNKVDREVQRISHWSFQGSTSLACFVRGDGRDRCVVTANVGDSRAVLSRDRVAVDLSEDHKPNDDGERRRIESLGGTVDWCGATDERGDPIETSGVYRINGNLALSRSIGDRSERPWVTAEADLRRHRIVEGSDTFVLLGTDGLFDVMTSQEVVSFVHDVLDATPEESILEARRNMAKLVVDEALRRGTYDNVTVLLVWIDENE